MQFSKAISLLLLFLTGISSFAQEYQPPAFTDTQREEKIENSLEKMDQLFEDYAKKYNFPSLSYGLVVDGQLVHAKSFGYVNLEKKIKASPQSDYHIASMTKSVTAMAVLRLRDEGKLSLDDPITKYIPEAKNTKLLTKDAPPITIRHLLTHNAGFPEDNPWGDRQLGQSEEWFKELYKEGISFSTATGTAYEYSNLGFSTLGLIIRSVSGKSYQEYIRENIFEPLGMHNTYWEYEEVPQDQFAVGYRYEGDQFVAQPLLHSGIFGAMGGLITSVEDFSKYMALHIAAWPARDDTDKGPVIRSSVREMHHPWNFATVLKNKKNAKGEDCYMIDAYGYGLHSYIDCDNLVSVEHSGGLPGYGSRWRILPDYGVGIVVFGNRTYAPTGDIMDDAVNALIKWADLQPRQLPASGVLQQRRDDLMKFLPNWENAKGDALFADNFFGDYFVADLQKASREAFENIGNITSVSDVVPENQLRGTFYINGENGKARVWFSLSPEPSPKIQAFRIVKE